MLLNNDAVVGRYTAVGELVLESAAHFGSGEKGVDTDQAIMRDAGGTPIICGSALAGVCRSFLAYQLLGEAAFGYLGGSELAAGQFNQAKQERYLRLLEKEGETNIGLLFGDWQFGENSNGYQSALLVYDAYPAPGSRVYVAKKDGVKINSSTGQAEDRAKYDLEVVEAGAAFTLKFELVIRQAYQSKAEELKETLGLILNAFEQGEIRLGAKTRRGLGRGRVKQWNVQDLDFKAPDQVLEWLRDRPPTAGRPKPVTLPPERQSFFNLEVNFEVENSILIRSYAEEVNQPDAVQLESKDQNGNLAPLIPGSSAGGVLRHRAARILRTLASNPDEVGKNYLWPLFGISGEEKEEKEQQRASRLRIEDDWLQGKVVSEVQSRIQLDRLTAGVLPGALFDEKPIWGKGLQWQLRCRLFEPKDYEVGLLLQVIKDIWLGDLAVGSGSGIGRGIMRGRAARLILQKEGNTLEWRFRQEEDKIKFEMGSAESLNSFTENLREELTKR